MMYKMVGLLTFNEHTAESELKVKDFRCLIHLIMVVDFISDHRCALEASAG